MNLLEKIIAGHGSEIKNIKGYEYKKLAHRIICQDGTEVSVQASRTHYCTPRLNQGPYSMVEVGYPTQDPPIEWAKYADGEYPPRCLRLRTDRFSAGIYQFSRWRDGRNSMTKKIGRNQPCPCNSGKKYKHCCLRKDRAKRVQHIPTSVEEVWATRRPIP